MTYAEIFNQKHEIGYPQFPSLVELALGYVANEVINSTTSPEKAKRIPTMIPLSQYSGPEQRLRGFNLMRNVVSPLMSATEPLYNPHIMVFNPLLYEEFRENGFRFTNDRKQEISEDLQQFIETSPLKSMAIRRSFFVPSTKNVIGGPTANDLQSGHEAAIKLEEMFQWAHGQGLDLEAGAEINCFAQEWQDSYDLIQAKGDVGKLPAGGDAIIENIRANGDIIIRLRVCLGENSTVNTNHTEADEYRILYTPPNEGSPAGKAKIISTKISPQKNYMILQRSTPPPSELRAIKLTDNKVDSNIYRVPIDHKTGIAQTLLSDPDINRVATACGILYHTQGKPYKLEFTRTSAPTTQGKVQTVTILEAIPWKLPEANGKPTKLYSGILRANISTPQDIELLRSKLEQFKEDKPLIHLTPEFILKINTQAGRVMLEDLKRIGRKLTIIAQLTDTDHKVNELSEDHTVYPIQATLLDLNIVYDIWQKGTTRWANRSETQHAKKFGLPRMLSIPQAIAQGKTSPEDIGGKAHGIARLVESRFNTPEFSIALTRAFFESLIQENGLEDLITQANNARSHKQLARVFKEIQIRITKIPHLTHIANGLKAACALIDENYKDDVIPHEVSVRSNVNYEDRPGALFAGKLETVAGVKIRKKEVLKKAMLKVIRSYFNPGNARGIFEDFRTSDRQDILARLNGSVLFHPMYKAVCSGTLFGREKAGQRRYDTIVINTNRGVGGGVEVDTQKESMVIRYDTNLQAFEGISVHTVDGETIELNESQLFELSHQYNREEGNTLVPIKLADYKPILTYEEAMSLVVLSQRMTRDLHSAQDSEWLKTPSGRLIFMQARNIALA